MEQRPDEVTEEVVAECRCRWQPAREFQRGDAADFEVFLAGCWLETELRRIGAPADDVEALGFSNGQKTFHTGTPWATARQSLADYLAGDWDRPGLDLSMRLIREAGPASLAKVKQELLERLGRLGIDPAEAIERIERLGCATGVPELGQASIAAVREFDRTFDALAGHWTADTGGRERWQGIRAWAIDRDGQLRGIPVLPLPVPACVADPDIVQKDDVISRIGDWSRRHRPDAVIVASEFWAYRMSDGESARMRAELGRTPDLMDEGNRTLLRRRYKAKVWESLVAYGELLGHLPRHRTWRINGSKLEPVNTEPRGMRRSVFNGILGGRPNIERKWHP